MPDSSLSRRRFLRRAGSVAAAIALPALVDHPVLGANERVTMGVIGCGGQGSFDMAQLGRTGRVDYAAACDVFSPHRERARKKAGAACASYNDFRKLLDRKDIDAVNIGTPDHWHTLIAIAACQAGKDIYCQKPLTLTIAEGQALVRAVRRYDRVFQTGSQQRSSSNFRYACELVRNGRIGKLQEIKTHVGRNPAGNSAPDADPPAGLDWNLYLGPARKVPFNPLRFTWNFRWFYDYSGGNLTDWGAHHNDIAQWGLGMDRSGPVKIDSSGKFPTRGLFDTALDYSVTYTYANGVKLTCDDKGNGVTFHGTDGMIYVNRGALSSQPEDIVKAPIEKDEVHLYESANHYANFVDCVASRKRPSCDVETGHRSVSVCHLGNISIRLGRSIRWDPRREVIVGDDEASRWLSRPMRGPWHL
jgi:predicted dehydrogenase